MPFRSQPDAISKADALVQSGSVEHAVHLLDKAIANGDGRAAATLAEWRLSGQIVQRDLALARHLYGQAASLGVQAAEPVHIAMLANGAGGIQRHWNEALTLLEGRAARDPSAARQSRLLAQMLLDEVGNPLVPATAKCLRGSPRVDELEGFLTAEECDYLIERAASHMQPSVVVDPRSGALICDPIRMAKSAGFPFVLEDPTLHAINRRIAAATGIAYEHGEPLQVLRYDVGDEYKLHSDTLPPGHNQRITTFLVALNDEFDGGETYFPRLGLTWRGQRGDALRFDNVDAALQPEQLMWHAGTALLRGTKFLLSKWIREKPLDLSGPPGRPC